MTINQRIRNKRIELGLSQQELADKLGYTDRSSITKIEKGLVDLTTSKVESFAKALHTTPAYLMGWSEDALLEDLAIYFAQLNGEGKEKILDYARLLCASGEYKKHDSAGMVASE